MRRSTFRSFLAKVCFHFVSKFIIKVNLINYAMYNVLLISLIYLSSSTSATLIKGSAIKCFKEGETVQVSFINNDPCIECKCLNQEIVCKREQCSIVKNCYLLNHNANLTCCNSCKGCNFQDIYYQSGSTWTHPQNSCIKYICASGVVTEYQTYCHVSCRNPIPAKPGECCPSCKGCEVNGQVYKEGEKIKNTDPCVTCKCLNGNMVCEKEACPVLACPLSKIINKPDSCCPVCRGQKKIFDSEKNCLIGNAALQNGQTYEYDKCTYCICNGTTNICKRTVCPSLDCPVSHQVIEPGQCCPSCYEAHEPRNTCNYGGQTYKMHDVWKSSRCTTCTCINGEVKCMIDKCNRNMKCPAKHKLIQTSKECCPVCVEQDGQCVLEGNPLTLSTFDGHTFKYEGNCNYVLTRDCQSKSFSVHVVNYIENYGGQLNNTAKDLIDFNTVIIKLHQIKVRLEKGGKVRIGRKLIALPYIKLGFLSIIKEGSNIIVRGNIGLKVKWNGKDNLEVIVPLEYKNKVCGICGNYNGEAKDDIATKRGLQIKDMQRFFKSWKVGKSPICTHNHFNNSKVSTCAGQKKTKAVKLCNLLRSSKFKICHHLIPIKSYFNSCVNEMCKCGDDQSCQCNEINMYLKRCEKMIGFKPNHFKCHLLDYTQGIKCPHSAVYSNCSTQCPRTCRNYRKPRVCRKPCKPGCECPKGKVWQNGHCVNIRQCSLPIIASSSIPLT